jgi:DNA-binding XRE family transcriptional regulator
MNDKKRKALVKAGYRIGDAADLLGLTDEERALLELRTAVSRAVAVQRKKRKVTQVTLAKMLHSSQSRVAKIEAGSSDVSLDLMFRSPFAVGGKAVDVLH